MARKARAEAYSQKQAHKTRKERDAIKVLRQEIASLSDEFLELRNHKILNLNWGTLFLDLSSITDTMLKLSDVAHPPSESDRINLVIKGLRLYISYLPQLLNDLLYRTMRFPMIEAEFPGHTKFVQDVPESTPDDLPAMLRDPFICSALAEHIEKQDWSVIHMLETRLKRIRPERPKGRKPALNPETGKPLRDELLRQKNEEHNKASYLATTYSEIMKRPYRDEAVTAMWSRARKGVLRPDPASQSSDRFLKALKHLEHARKDPNKSFDK
jgi:hypothetical protein